MSSDTNWDSDSQRRPKNKRSVQDFKFGACIGEGSYGQVLFGTEIATGQEFAVKVLCKRHVFKENKAKYVKMERNVLNCLDHPNIVKLYYTFQDSDSLYFVLELAKNGELLHHLRKHGTLDVPCTKFYLAELVSALEHVHSRGIIHRDLKPENILLSHDMHVKLTDFGTAKFLVDDNGERTKSFVGTAEYVSPEVLDNEPASRSSDLWALGCILYQMLAGEPPFKAANEYQTFQKIMKLSYEFPANFPETAASLVQMLLNLNPVERLGFANFEDLKRHPFFEGVDFDTISSQTPPEMCPLQVVEEQRTDDAKEEEANSMLDMWKHFLLDQESIVYTAPVVKHKGLSSKKRQLLVTSFPRIVYVDPDRMQQRGEVPWSEKLWAEAKNARTFLIHCPGRTYNFQDLSGNAQRWVDVISRIQAQSGRAENNVV